MRGKRSKNQMDTQYGYIPYRLPNDTKIYLTARPDAYHPRAVERFVTKFKPKIRFQFTDDPVDYQGQPRTVHWYPWRPLRRLPVELIYPVLSLMNRYVNQRKTMWLHCDSSSMRAPTFMGLFLLARYPEQAEEICRTEWHDRARDYTNPICSARTSFKLDPEVQQMIRAWQCGGEKMAYAFCHRQTGKVYWYGREKPMDFEGFYQAVQELMPGDFREHAKVLNYLEEVEYNTQYLAPEIYKPKDEIKSFLQTVTDADEDQWVKTVLDRLEQS
jgi:hypothetical protein